MCVIFLRITSEGKSQSLNPNDTLCFYVYELQNILIGAKQGNELKERVTILSDRISNLQGIIRDMEYKDSATVAGYEKRITELYVQKEILEKLLRKEKRKRFWTSVGGGAATVGAFWLGMQMGK